jgi:hypothetical protein
VGKDSLRALYELLAVIRITGPLLLAIVGDMLFLLETELETSSLLSKLYRLVGIMGRNRIKRL